MDNTAVIHIQSDANDASITAPFLIQGAAGIPKDMEFNVYRHENIAKKPRHYLLTGERTLTEEYSKMYECVNASLDKSQLFHYALGVLDNNSKILYLKNVTRFVAKETEKSEIIGQDDDTTLDGSDNIGKRARAAVSSSLGKHSSSMDLVDAFGSKRSKRIMNVLEKRNSQKTAIQLAEKVLKDASESLNGPIDRISQTYSGESKRAEEERTSFFPPFNLGATTLDTAFPFQDFMPPSLLIHCEVKGMIDNHNLVPWVSQRLSGLTSSVSLSKDPSKALVTNQKVYQLILMQYLITMYKMKEKSLRDLFGSFKKDKSDKNRNKGEAKEHISIPSPLAMHFLEVFSKSSQSLKTNNTQDLVAFMLTTSARYKMVCYICVLALIIEGCDGVSIVSLLRELPDLSLTRLQTIFRQLGCVVRKSSKKHSTGSSDSSLDQFAVLKLPLEFPNLKSRGPQKRF
jgi:hypothetical protein